MARFKLTPTERRELTLRALKGESRAALAREFGVSSKGYVHTLINEAKEQPEAKAQEAVAEAEFRKTVLSLIRTEAEFRKTVHSLV